MTDVESSALGSPPDGPNARGRELILRITRQRVVLGVAGLFGIAAVAMAILFGVLWGSTVADLEASESSLAKSEASLAAAQNKASSAQQALDESEAELAALTRNAKYAACVNYYGGFTQGSGFSAAISVSVATSSCASESNWTQVMPPAP